MAAIPKLIIRVTFVRYKDSVATIDRFRPYLMVASTTRFPRAIFLSSSAFLVRPWNGGSYCRAPSCPQLPPPRFNQENWSIIFHASSTQAPWHWKTLLNGYSPDQWFSMDAHRLFHSASITSLASFAHNASRPLCMFSYTYILEIMDLCIFFFLIYLSCSRFIKLHIYFRIYFRNYEFMYFFFKFFFIVFPIHKILYVSYIF